VIRLGARVVFDEDGFSVPAIEPRLGVQGYLRQPAVTDPRSDEEPKLAESEEKRPTGLSQRRLRPREHELAVKVALPNQLMRDVVEYPELAWALKEDIAEVLAFRADQAFLNGAGNPEPLGICNTAGVATAGIAAIWPPRTGTDRLNATRAVVEQLRRVGQPFRNPGWILHPSTLDTLASPGVGTLASPRVEGTRADTTRLLAYDGRDGGTLLGYRFLVSAAAMDGGVNRMYFSSDWTEAWVAADRELVTIDVSTDAHFETDETVVRAVMHHDFAVRRPEFFVFADLSAKAKRVAKSGGGSTSPRRGSG
jgi:HK97 family phage major capsid protein